MGYVHVRLTRRHSKTPKRMSILSDRYNLAFEYFSSAFASGEPDELSLFFICTLRTKYSMLVATTDVQRLPLDTNYIRHHIKETTVESRDVRIAAEHVQRTPEMLALSRNLFTNVKAEDATIIGIPDEIPPATIETHDLRLVDYQ